MSKSVDTLSLLQRALYALKDLESRYQSLQKQINEPIAVIGMSCRFPGRSVDPEAYWKMLRNGTDTVQEVPPERWNLDVFYDPDPEVRGKMYTRYGAFLEQIDTFDPEFFGVSKHEASSMDPQQRLLLEVGWETLERAGQATKSLEGSRTGVFVGISTKDFGDLLMMSNDGLLIDPSVISGTTASVAAGRISYLLGLQGPCFPVDTACSSSLVTVHLACQSLRSNDCDLALAGGVNITLSPIPNVAISRFRMLSPDGRCKAFDRSANGYVRGEGCGMVALKRLADALADRDPILAVIRGSAVNQDGRSGGLTAPNGPAQQAVIRRALDCAGVDPLEVGYVEAHGTGTELGDPIEMESLAKVLCDGRTNDCRLLVGSVKTNIGHLEAAAGIAGLIKVILMLQHREVPPHLHLRNPNPHIGWDRLPVRIPTEFMGWPRGNGGRRLAGVSSFGFMGTNAHVILEESPENESRRMTERPVQLLALSAKSSDALHELTDRYRQHLAGEEAPRWEDTCYTSTVGRSHYRHRIAVRALDEKEALQHLAQDQFRTSDVSAADGRRKIGFLFTGQGSQYAGMGKALYNLHDGFRQSLNRCAEILDAVLGRSLLELMFEDANGEINQTCYAQPALFALEYALADMWKSWGVKPAAVMGHSLGEYVAACVAGVFSLKDGLEFIAKRARLMHSLPHTGAMAAVYFAEARIADAIRPFEDVLSIAALNGPNQTVVAGEQEQLELFLRSLSDDGISWQRLDVSHAFHSPAIEPILDEFERLAENLDFQPPRITIASNLTGRIATKEELCHPNYWRRHMRAPVRFAQCLTSLREYGVDTFLEIGPHAVLLALGQQCLNDAGLTWLASLCRGKDSWEQLLESVATLYVNGMDFEWNCIHQGRNARKTIAPTHPFQRKRLWHKAINTGLKNVTRLTRLSSQADIHPLLGRRLSSPLKAIQFQALISAESLAFLSEHRVHGLSIFPATAYVAMALAAARHVMGFGTHSFENLTIEEPVGFLPGEERLFQTIISQDEDSRATVQICHRLDSAESDTEWRACSTVQLRRDDSGHDDGDCSLEEIRRRCPNDIPIDVYHDACEEKGLQLGPSFRGAKQVWAGRNEALGLIETPASLEDASQYEVHPAILDACMQVLGIAIASAHGGTNGNDIFLPVAIEKVTCSSALDAPLWSHASVDHLSGRSDANTLIGSVRIFAGSGERVMSLERVILRRANSQAFLSAFSSANHVREWFYDVEWREKPLGTSAAHLTTIAEADKITWLVFADSGGVGHNLATRLREEGGHAVLAYAGDAFERIGEVAFRLRPTHVDDYQRLFASLENMTPIQIGIVHLWSLDVPSLAMARGDVTLIQELGCQSVLHLIKTCVQLDPIKQPRVWLATRGVHKVNGSFQLSPEQAPLWGFGRVIASEYPGLRCVCIDLDGSVDTLQNTEFLIAELRAPQRENQIVYRNGQRRVARLAQRPPSSMSAQKNIFYPDCSYLITGGRGALGLQIAEWMAKKGAQHLILAGRSELTEKARLVIDKLAALGVHVRSPRCDIANASEVAAMFHEIGSRGPALRGIFHAAGVIDDGLIQDQTWERFSNVLAPKVSGTINLHRSSLELELDYFVLFSSIASLFGSPLQANYAAANAFLDSLAHYRAALGLPALSVNWGPWQGGGMVESLNLSTRDAWNARGIGMIMPEEGLAALEKAMTSGLQQTVIAPINRKKLMDQFRTMDPPPLLSEFALGVERSVPESSPALRKIAAEIKSANPAALKPLVWNYVSQLTADTLGRSSPDQLDPSLPLSQLGLDSLMAMEFQNQVRMDLGIELPVSAFFADLNLEKLIDLLFDRFLAGNLDRLSDEQAIFLEEKLLFLPARFPEGDWQPTSFQFEDVEFIAADGVRLHGWYCTIESPRAVILMSHGNAGNITHRAEEIRLWQRHLGVSVFIYDYRGYGRSQGSSNERGVYTDVRAAYRWLAEQKAIAPGEIVLRGESIGAAVSLDLALEVPHRSLIMESPFTSAVEMGERSMSWIPVRRLMRNRFESIEKISKYHGPLLVTHGTRDSIVPFEMGERLFKRANEPKRFYAVRGADHNDVPFVGGAAYFQAIDEFLKSYQ